MPKVLGRNLLEALCSAAGWRQGKEQEEDEEEEEDATEMPEDSLRCPAVNEVTTRWFGGTNFIGDSGD